MATLRYYLRNVLATGSGLPTSENSPDSWDPVQVNAAPSSTSLRDMSPASGSAGTTGWAGQGVPPPFIYIPPRMAATEWFIGPPLPSGSITGSMTYYIGRQMATNGPPDFHTTQFRPFFYLGRPGFGFASMLFGPVTDIADFVPDANMYARKVTGPFPPSTNVNVQPGDRIVFEMWVDGAGINPAGASLPQWYFAYDGNVDSHTDGAPITLNNIASYLEVDFIPASGGGGGGPPVLSASSVYIKNVFPHPFDSNKLRAIFSAPVQASSLTGSIFTLAPPAASTCSWATHVPGTTDQVDLHFGSELPLTSSTWALWRFDEETGNNIADSVGTYHLTASSATITNDGCFRRGRYFDGSTSLAASSYVGPSFATQKMFYGEHCIDVMIKLSGSTIPTWNNIIKFGGAQNSEAENNLTGLGSYSDGRIHVLMQYSGAIIAGGANRENYILSDPALAWDNKMHLITMRKRNSTLNPSLSWYSVDLFLDGKILKSWDTVRRTTGGTSTNVKWQVGYQQTYGERVNGFIDSIRITSGAFSDAEIIAYHTAALYPFTRGTKYTLSASNVLDTSGYLISGVSSSFDFVYYGLDDLNPSGALSMTRTFYNSGSNKNPGDVPLTTDLGMTRTYYNSASDARPGAISQVALSPAMQVIYNYQYGKTTVLTPPTIGSFVPSPGSKIQSNQSIALTVNDDGPLRRVILHAMFPNHNIQEVIHDGDSFGLSYKGATNVRNVVSTAPATYNYVILRDGGWPENPTITPFAIDVTGSENL